MFIGFSKIAIFVHDYTTAFPLSAFAITIEGSDLSRRIANFKSDPSIVIAKADKGNAVVVMEKDGYLRKANEQLSDSNIYKTLPNNPQNLLKNSVNKVLQRLKSEKKLSKAEYDLLYVLQYSSNSSLIRVDKNAQN